MTALPLPVPSVPARLFDLVQAPLRWQLVETALRLGLFEALHAPAAAAEAARSTGLDAGRLETVLNALAAMDLLTKTDGRFQVAPSAAPFVMRDGARSMVDLLLTLPKLRHGPVESLLVQGAPPGAAPRLDDAAFWDASAASLRALHRSMGAESMLAVLEGLPEWAGARAMLDLGAGSDVLARLILDTHPRMAVTLCDLPPLAARFASLRDEPGTAGRVTILSGDYNDVDLGGPYDVVWASMTLYYARDLTALFGRLRAALRPGGVVVALHESLTDEGTRPECHVVGRLVPELRGQSRSFKDGEIAAAMRAAGLTSVEQRPVLTGAGLLSADLGRP
ncbi:MAG: class I SAM-dependent methyltransferase [Caenispirillum sp.]|nr:class I SAM-dependent methyltransferase [Caenispirillum sp.]